MIDVIDTGVGIGDEDPEALFERLFRAPNAVAQQMQGAGLGLTIALAIVEAHAGTIEVRAQRPGGKHLPDDLPAADAGVLSPQNSRSLGSSIPRRAS